MTPLPRALGAIVTLSLAAAAAHAGQITATASLNPEGSVNNPSSGSFTSADYPPGASAEVSRTAIHAQTDGTGVTPPWTYGAGGTANTNYTLWNRSTDSALDAGVAASLTLAFDFTLQGSSSLPTVSLSTMSLSWDAALYSADISSAAGGLSGVFGPTGYLFTGDTSLLGDFDQSFSLVHSHASGGLWTMGFSTTASHFGDASGTLALAGIRLIDGAAPVGGLAVRLETGELIPVTAVPEVSPQWMMLAGLLGLGAFLRRRAG